MYKGDIETKTHLRARFRALSARAHFDPKAPPSCFACRKDTPEVIVRKKVSELKCKIGEKSDARQKRSKSMHCRINKPNFGFHA